MKITVGQTTKTPSKKFIQLVEETRQHIPECTIDEVNAKLDRGEKFYLIDIREDAEFIKLRISVRSLPLTNTECKRE